MDFDKDRNVTTSCNIENQIHLSTACTWDKDRNWALWPLFEDGIKKGIIQESDASYFQLFTIPGMPGTVSLNCPRIVSDKDIDPIDMFGKSIALMTARKQIWRLYNFMKQYFPGFEDSYISNIADMLGVRESRQVQCLKVYTKEDILSGKRYDNPVLHADYPIDIHSYKKDSSTLQHIKVDYELPIECLKSADYDNLYIAGRNVSADFSAQAAFTYSDLLFFNGRGCSKRYSKNFKNIIFVLN